MIWTAPGFREITVAHADVSGYDAPRLADADPPWEVRRPGRLEARWLPALGLAGVDCLSGVGYSYGKFVADGMCPPDAGPVFCR